jgi:hypothetical protein
MLFGKRPYGTERGDEDACQIPRRLRRAVLRTTSIPQIIRRQRARKLAGFSPVWLEASLAYIVTIGDQIHGRRATACLAHHRRDPFRPSLQVRWRHHAACTASGWHVRCRHP